MKSIFLSVVLLILICLLRKSRASLVNLFKLPGIDFDRRRINDKTETYSNSFEQRFNMYLKNTSLPMPMPISPAETKYVEFSLNQIQAELKRQEAVEERKAKERSDTKWTRTVIIATFIGGCSFYLGVLDLGRGVITPKFKEQLTASFNQLIKVVSEFSIFRLPFKIRWPFGGPK